MGKKGHREEEILRVLREAESGDTAVEICRKRGISQQTAQPPVKTGRSEARKPKSPINLA